MALMDEAEATERAGILKRDALGRVTMSQRQREAMLDAFERSGLKAAQFARAAGVNYQTFASWVQRRRHERGEYARKPEVAPAALRLVEAVVAAPDASHGEDACEARTVIGTATGVPLEVQLPGGARMLVRDTAQVPLVAQLLRALSRPC
jgi:DNA-binding transcriptional regulator YiaG